MSARERPSRRARADASFERLYRRHRTEVYRSSLGKVGDHFEAEDVTQTAFLNAYGAILRGAEPELPRAWLLAIAENVRRRRFRLSLARPREAPLVDVEAPGHDDADTADLVAALGSLPRNQRFAFLLREIGGLSYGEIAQRLELSVASVQMLLFRARQALRAELGEPSLATRARQAIVFPASEWLSNAIARLEASAPLARSLGAAGGAALVVGGVAVTGGASASRDATPLGPRTPAPAARSPVAARPSAPEPATRVVRVSGRPVAPAISAEPAAKGAATDARPPAPPAAAEAPAAPETTPSGPEPVPLPPVLAAIDDVPAALPPLVVDAGPAGEVPVLPIELPALPTDLVPSTVPAAAEEVGGALPELPAP